MWVCCSPRLPKKAPMCYMTIVEPVSTGMKQRPIVVKDWTSAHICAHRASTTAPVLRLRHRLTAPGGLERRELPHTENPADWRRFCLGAASCAGQPGGKEVHCSGADGEGSAGAHAPSLQFLQQLSQARLLPCHRPRKWLC